MFTCCSTSMKVSLSLVQYVGNSELSTESLNTRIFDFTRVKSPFLVDRKRSCGRAVVPSALSMQYMIISSSSRSWVYSPKDTRQNCFPLSLSSSVSVTFPVWTISKSGGNSDGKCMYTSSPTKRSGSSIKACMSRVSDFSSFSSNSKPASLRSATTFESSFSTPSSFFFTSEVSICFSFGPAPTRSTCCSSTGNTSSFSICTGFSKITTCALSCWGLMWKYSATGGVVALNICQAFSPFLSVRMV